MIIGAQARMIGCRRTVALNRALSSKLSIAVVIAAATLSSACVADAYAEGGSAAVAWGSNYPAEQLGAGYADNYEPSPVTVVGLTNIAAVAATYNTSFALLSDGTVKAWGDGKENGLLGDGAHGQTGTPVLVSGLTGVTAIATGNAHVLALLSDGKVMAWGDDHYGELGNGKASSESSDAPVEVEKLENVAAIAAGGASSFAVLKDGKVMAWGENYQGQLGQGKYGGPEECKGPEGKRPCSVRPIEIPGLSGVASVSSGETAAYALLSSGEVKAWGNNEHGQLGTAEAVTASDAPVTVKELSKVVELSAGNTFVLARLESGKVMGWGSDGAYQLGGAALDECFGYVCDNTPTLVEGLEKVTAVSAGNLFSLAVSGEQIYSFGEAEHGQLGEAPVKGVVKCGEHSCRKEPTAIPGFGPLEGRPVGGIAAGRGAGISTGQHSLAFLTSGSGPPPLLKVVPLKEEDSLEVVWTVTAASDNLRWKPEEGAFSKLLTIEGKSAEECNAGHACHEVIKEYKGKALGAAPYEIQFWVPEGTEKKIRNIVATP